MNKKYTQNGNALWFILIAILLLGLLTAMMTRSGSSTNETGSYEQQIIQANEILDYARSIEYAVQLLLAKGCSENQLDFSYDHDGDGIYSESEPINYFNTSAPSDLSCHIFHKNGAGIHYIDVSEKQWAANISRAIVSGSMRGPNLGENALPTQKSADLLFRINSLNSLDICLRINEIVGIQNTVGYPPRNPDRPFDGSRFTGNMGGASNELITTGNETLGKTSGCLVYDNGTGNGDEFYFYHALHIR